MLCQPVNKIDFLNDIVSEVKDILETVEFKNNVMQLGLQVKDPEDLSEDAWYNSVGRIQRPGGMIIEPEYKFIHPRLKGSYIEKWLNSLTEYRVVRTRLMYMLPRSCYSIHSDPYPRIHLPVITNKQCLMCFPDHSAMEHMPADGTSYYVDTTKRHTFINCSEAVRIHLVGVLLPRLPKP